MSASARRVLREAGSVTISTPYGAERARASAACRDQHLAERHSRNGNRDRSHGSASTRNSHHRARPPHPYESPSEPEQRRPRPTARRATNAAHAEPHQPPEPRSGTRPRRRRPPSRTRSPRLRPIASRKQLVMPSRRHSHRLGVLLPQPRRTLHVGEQKRHHPRRNAPGLHLLAHHGAS